MTSGHPMTYDMTYISTYMSSQAEADEVNLVIGVDEAIFL